jgi:integrase
MPRTPQASWHKGAKAWCSAVGDLGENGRRKPVYFREIPYGSKNSTAYRKAQEALRAFLDARDARSVRGDDPTFYDLSKAYLLWLKGRVERGKAKPLTLRGHLKAIKKFRALEFAPNRIYRNKVAREMNATELALTVQALTEVDRGDDRPRGYAPNYIARIVASVQAVLNWAADPLPGREPESLIDRNPVAKFTHEATQAAHSPDRYAQASEVKAFLDWGYARAEVIGGLAGRFERITIDLVKVSYLTGTRPGELRVAERGDFEAKAVYLEQLGQWWGRIRLDPSRWKSGSKTKKAREIFLPPEAVAIVEAILALPDHHPRFIWTHRRGNHSGDRGATVATHGEPWSDSALPNKVCRLRRLAIADGVELENVGENRFVLYRLRHTRAADLLMAGVDISTVAKLLGTSVAMIERTYASFTISHLAEAAGKGLGNLGGSGLTPSPPFPSV